MASFRPKNVSVQLSLIPRGKSGFIIRQQVKNFKITNLIIQREIIPTNTSTRLTEWMEAMLM